MLEEFYLKSPNLMHYYINRSKIWSYRTSEYFYTLIGCPRCETLNMIYLII